MVCLMIQETEKYFKDYIYTYMPIQSLEESPLNNLWATSLEPIIEMKYDL